MFLIKRIAKLLMSPWVRTRGPSGGLYLTFDDGPNPVHTRAVLEILARYGVKATFFMVGEEMERHKDIVSEAVAQGHVIGFHSYRHRHLSEQTRDEVIDDLRQVADLAARLGLPFALYRPPYGEFSLRRVLWCISHGVLTVMWSLESRDSFVASEVELVAQLAPGRVTGGDIILLHDDTPVTVSALPMVLEQLLNSGLHFGVVTK